MAKELKKHIQIYVHEIISYKRLYNSPGLLLKQGKFRDNILRYQVHELAGIQSGTSNFFIQGVFH